MKINRWITTVGVALGVIFGSTALANHVPMKLEEGVKTRVFSSFCKTEGTAVSVTEEFVTNGMSQANRVYNIYVKSGECINITTILTPIRLVVTAGSAMVVEVLLENGKTVYLLAPNVSYSVGDPA